MRRAFSLIELAIVVAIIGIIAAIALPRISSAADRSRRSALRADLIVLNEAVYRYTVEHADRDPATNAAGAADPSASNLMRRLVGRTDPDGNINNAGLLGPYLNTFPPNPVNALNTVRIGGAAAGANTHGWRYSRAQRVIEPDHSDPAYVADALDIGEVAGKAGGTGALDVGGAGGLGATID